MGVSINKIPQPIAQPETEWEKEMQDLVLKFSKESSDFARDNLYANAVTVTEDTTLGVHTVINIDATSGNVTVTLPPLSKAEYKIYWIKRVDSSGNTVTINGDGVETIDGEATKELEQYDSVSLTPNATEWGTISDKNSSSGSTSGEVKMWGGSIDNLPDGHLFCNGDAVSRSTYADLFSAIGTIHGIGNGSTTFNLPDLRDAMVVGSKQDDSGVPKTNISGSLTQSGGSGTKNIQHTHGVGGHVHTTSGHTLTIAEIPSHTHSTPIGTGNAGYNPTLETTVQRDSTVSTGSTGGGGSHTHGNTGSTSGTTDNGGSTTQDVLNPYYTMSYMIVI